MPSLPPGASEPQRKVVRLSHVHIEDVGLKRPKLEQLLRDLIRRYTLTSAQVKMGVAGLALVGIAFLTINYLVPIALFGLTLIIRTLFYAFYSVRVEVRRFEAKVAARSLAAINVFAYVSVIAALLQSNAIWRYGAFAFLIFALTMEIVGVRTWYTRWVISDREANRAAGLRGTLYPREGHLLAVGVWLIGEYIAYLILWIPIFDKILLFIWRFFDGIIHVIEALVHAL